VIRNRALARTESLNPEYLSDLVLYFTGYESPVTNIVFKVSQGGKNMTTAQAGTLESMDCIVSVPESDKGRGISIVMEGASVARFGEAMVKATKDTLKSLGVRDISVSIQDNGAGDLVLKARVEAAVRRLAGGKAA
jgi:citrate lyase subunit gamma (acyl carrier protein)